MATEQKQDAVTFVNVQKSYPPGEQLKIGYTLSEELKRSTRDWVGLFKVGWTSSRDYYTFEWAPALTDLNLDGEVTFAGRRLPPEDNHFYQFCYVTSDGRVRGASPPFQFLAVSLARLDDLELVEIGEESLIILQPKKNEKDNDIVKLSTVNESLKCEKDELVKQLEEVELNREETLKEKDEQITDLERQVAMKRESEQRLVEKLEGERAQNQELIATNQKLEQCLAEKVESEQALSQELSTTKANIAANMTALSQRLADVSAQLRSENKTLHCELETLKGQHDEKIEELKTAKDQLAANRREIIDLKGTMRVKDAQIEDLGYMASTRGRDKEQLAAEAEQLQGRLLEVQQIRADLIEDNEAKQVKIDQLVGRLTVNEEEVAALSKEVEQLKQELACAQENVAELVGAGPNAVIVHQPTAAPAIHDEPPTQPPTQDSIVDKAAYDALLQAYESLEGSLIGSKDSNKELTLKLQNAQLKVDEMVARLELAKEQYEILAKENYELKRRSRTPVPPTGDKPVDQQLKEMESINKELVASCEVASQQLSARREEMKQQQSRVDQLEGELAQVKLELEQFQDKHDKVVHAKTESLDKQQAVLDAKLKELVECQQALQTSEREKSKLEGIVRQLRAQLDALKAAAGSSERSCPVCETKFPGRVSQRDFETHVQAHFRV